MSEKRSDDKPALEQAEELAQELDQALDEAQEDAYQEAETEPHSDPADTVEQQAEQTTGQEAEQGAEQDVEQVIEQAAEQKIDAEDSVDTPTDEPAPEQEAPAPAAKQGGRGLTWFALLLALVALGGGAYLYYQLIYLAPLATLEANVAKVQTQGDSELQQVRTSLAEQQAEVASLLEQAQQSQTEALNETQQGVLESLQEALLAAPPSQREWQLAEAEYLLRIGNHRVLMEQDTQGALLMFQAVDQIMAEIDDFALHQVRAILADETMALRRVPRQDVQGLYLRLEAIKSQIEGLVFKTPDYIAADATEDETQTVWQQLLAQAKEFVRVRRVGGEETLQPLLAPSEEQYLELNLRLSLEQAQLALLKRQQAVYVESLQNVGEWITQYAEDPNGAVAAEIAELMSDELEQPLPDVSRSLSELRKIRAGGE